MLISQFLTAAAALSVSVFAAPSKDYQHGDDCPKDADSYCPSICHPGRETRLRLFKEYNDHLWSGDAAGAYAKYVSKDIVDHSATISNYEEGVEFLTAIFSTVDVKVINDLEWCQGDVCTVYYSATPKPNVVSPLTNVTAITDIYRYEGSCLVEAWVTVQSANGHTTNPTFPG